MPNNPLGPRPGGNASELDISADAVVIAFPSMLYRVSVIVAGSGAGSVHDVAAIADAADGNRIGIIPATVGDYEFVWPCAHGIVYKRGTGQSVSISSAAYPPGFGAYNAHVTAAQDHQHVAGTGTQTGP